MSSNNNKNRNINKFFNRLYLSFPIMKPNKKDKLVNNELNEIKYIYTNKDSTKWFFKGENNNKEVFLFGKIKDNIPQPPLLTLTFDKVSAYSDKCSSIINANQIYIKTKYFIDNYPNFKTKLNEQTIDIFVDGHANTIDVINLGEYAENIEEFLKNLDIILDELEDYGFVEKNETMPLQTESIMTNSNVPESNFSNNEKSCEICGKKLKKREKKLCRKCLQKRHAAKILKKLLKYVPPQTPFTRKDLEQIYSEERKVNDCIWSLQDYSLIQQNNGAYYLVEKDILDKFIETYDVLEESVEKEEENEEHKKLNKQCTICKKTLPISKFYRSKITDDGLEDYCKYCKRYVNAANYLKDILNQVSPGSEFKAEDITNDFENPMEFTGRLWELQDFDLLTYDSDKETYLLTDLETCQQFLDEYYISGSVNVKIETKKEEEPKKDTKDEQMDRVIESIRNGKTDKEAAEIAGINLYNITHWFNEGKNNSGEENINFYNRYIEAKKEAKINSIKNFYVIESFNSKQDLTIADTLRKQQMEKVLKEMGSGVLMEAAAFNSGITYETLQYWYKRGKQNFGEEYNEFYEKINLLQSPIETPNPDESNMPVKQDENNNSKEQDERDLFEHILDPLPRKYSKRFRKPSSSGISWVNKINNNWVYNNPIFDIKISDHNLYKLYLKVKKQNCPWGVRDVQKAKESLAQCRKPKYQNETNEKLIEIKSDVTCVYFNNDTIIKAILTGTISSDKLMKTIAYFNEFEENIVRIITTKSEENIELFIEFNLNETNLNKFKISIEKLNGHLIKEYGDKTDNSSNPKVYTEEELLYGKPENIVILYEKVKESVLKEFDNVEIIIRKLYISFRINNKYIASISPITQHIKAWINIEHINDYKFKTRDVSNIGHWGVGNYEYIIQSEKDIDYFLELFKQSYNEKL